MDQATPLSPSRLQRLLLALCLLLLAPGCLPGRAQTTQGAIVGNVKDTAGAMIPNAMITLTNTDEGTTRNTKSNGTGDYRFLDVKAGHYKIDITAANFSPWSATSITLAVRQELRVDAELNIGSVQQSVQVTGEAVSAIETETATISGSFTSDDATNLPVNTRASFSGTSAANILGTMPGVQDDSSGISVQGALPYQVEVTVDGVTLKNPSGGSFIGDAFPSTESIAEIRTDGVLAGAEYSDPAQVVVTTKGGGNQFHGTGFWYYQDSAFDAIAYTYPTTKTKPSQHGNTFGGSFGGPVLLPHYNGHNKTFFYGAYEGWRHPAQTTLNEVVPSTAMKQGDFSNYLKSDGEGGWYVPAVTDPYTGTAYSGNKIPTVNTIAASTLKQFYPDPNIGNAADYTDNGVANYQANVDQSGHSNQFDVRGDQYFGSNQKFLIWGRFTWKNFPTTSPQILDLPSSSSNSQSRVLKVDTN